MKRTAFDSKSTKRPFSSIEAIWRASESAVRFKQTTSATVGSWTRASKRYEPSDPVEPVSSTKNRSSGQDEGSALVRLKQGEMRVRAVPWRGHEDLIACLDSTEDQDQVPQILRSDVRHRREDSRLALPELLLHPPCRLVDSSRQPAHCDCTVAIVDTSTLRNLRKKSIRIRACDIVDNIRHQRPPELLLLRCRVRAHGKSGAWQMGLTTALTEGVYSDGKTRPVAPGRREGAGMPW